MQKVMKPITVVFMGDSISEGQYIHHSLRWTERIINSLRIEVERVYKDQSFLHCFNRGISGETTRQGLERFPRDVQNLSPDIMTLQFGLNDCNCWISDKGLPRVSEKAYEANLEEMIFRAQNFGAKHIVAITSHPTLVKGKLISGEKLEDRRKKYNQILRKVVKKCQIDLCDIEKVFDKFSKFELRNYLLPEPDLLHLSINGHELYHKVVYPQVLKKINELIKETGIE